jgi:type I restriction enzyme M protein
LKLNHTIKTIQDIMRKDVGLDGDAQRMSQLAWMVLLKICEDSRYISDRLDDNVISPIPNYLRWDSWAANPLGLTGDALIEFVNNELFPVLKNLPETGKHADLGYVVREVFRDAHNYMKSGLLMRHVINKINDIDFSRSTERHLFGDIYEKILQDLQNAGNAGEFYTPRAVTQFMVDMLDPNLGEKLLDPACGTGGFLTCSIEHLCKKYSLTPVERRKLQDYIMGVEKKPLPHMLCVTNMLLHGLEVPYQIRHDNTLVYPMSYYNPEHQVDVVLTNPPFGGMEEDSVGPNFSSFRTKETADLFLVFITHILKPGGRAGIILPDGVLRGEGTKARIREHLLRECDLHTIIRLPNGVFSPYTGIKTNLLFFEKGKPTTQVWCYEHPYPLGYKSYSKTKPLLLEEFDAEKGWWHNRVENQYAWRVSIEQIEANGYNLDLKNPNGAIATYPDPEQLLTEYNNLAMQIETVRNELKHELISALRRSAL